MFKQITYNLKNNGWSILLLLICITIPLSFRWSSYLLVLSYLAAVVYHINTRKKFEWNFFSVGCVLFFIWQTIEVFNSDNVYEAIKQLERKLSFLLLPLFWQTLNKHHKTSVQKWIFNYLPVLTGGIGLLCFGVALNTYVQVEQSTVFFYHNLVYFIEANAIYFSCSLLISVSLIFHRLNTNPVFVKIGLIGLHIGLLYLLSSKMFWLLSVLSISIYCLRLIKPSKRIVVLPLLIIGIIAISQTGVIKNRYAEVIEDHLIIDQENITPNTTFTGVNFRIYLLQKGLDMALETPHAFILGNGIGDVQTKLNKAYIEDDLYLGNQRGKDNGYLDYNFHNQYIQTFTESGIVGLLLLVFIIGSLILYGFKVKNESLIFLNLMFVCAFFTESYLNRAMGVFLFLAFNSIFLSINNSKSQRFQFEKRCFDILFSLASFVFVLGWLLPIVSIIVWIDMKHNPIFIQKRVGQNGKLFYCYKIRTMVINRKANIQAAELDDVRITRIGKWLRRFGIDELPQLFNVLQGQMSIVGPRPLMVKEERTYNEDIPGFSNRLRSKPGITGLSQSLGKKGYVDTIYDIRERYKIDMLYSTKKSVMLDVKIVLRTVYNMYLRKR